MKAWIATLTILLFISTSPLLAQERMLKGQVLLVGENGETTPATGVDITFNETGDTTRSKTSGLFKIFLPDIFKSGETLTLQVKKQGWRIQYPLDGEARIPANLLKETVIIRLLPVGSKQFWTEDRIKKYIENVAEKSKEQVTQNGKPEDIDLNRYIKEWATQYGFSAKQAKQQIDNWISEVEKKDDYEERGLAAHAKKKFGKAGKLLSRAAKDRADEIKSLNDKTASAMREAVKLSRLAGDAYYNNYNFEAALAEYEQALLYIDKNESPQLWASVYINIGNTNNNIGIRTSGKSIHQFLSAAVAAYRLALEVYTREAVPQGWATTQNNLANALRDQAARTAGNAGAKLLGEAVAAYRLALEVRTREALPQDWAQTQNNLANALIGQAARTAGNAGAKLLSEAVAAYRLALEVRTREALPQNWATTQNNLANALRDQAARTAGNARAKLLSEAVAAFRLALEVRTREALPKDWAATQSNLAAALSNQAVRTSGKPGIKLMNEAVTAYHLALEVYTREALPQNWAMTQNNLAIALSNQAARTTGNAGAKLLSEAVAASRLALEVYTREALPQNWATTQNNLANALRDQAARTTGNAGAKLLSEAVAAYRLALEVRTREALPQGWAMTQNNLANALSDQAARTTGNAGAKLLSEAVAAYRLALEVRTREALPQGWAQTQNNLGKAYLDLKDWQKSSTAFTNVLEIYSNHYKTLSTLTFLNHEKLFQFNKALELNEQMLKLKPDDLNVKTELAEKYFTTKQFMKSQKSIEKLLPHSQITATLSIPLLAINIANKIALEKNDSILTDFEYLQKNLSDQSKSFIIFRSFSGIKQSIRLNSKLASQQKKLIALFNALEGEDRDAILRLLQKVRADFFKT